MSGKTEESQTKEFNFNNLNLNEYNTDNSINLDELEETISENSKNNKSISIIKEIKELEVEDNLKEQYKEPINSSKWKKFYNIIDGEKGFKINISEFKKNLLSSSKANYKENKLQIIFIIILSLVLTITLQFMNIIINKSIQLRLYYSSFGNIFVAYFIWIASGTILFLLATMPGHFISPNSDGSGIPEIKAILSGTHIFRFLSFESFIGKAIGTILCLVAGASVGRVGPYVHLSACICTYLLKIEYFKELNEKQMKICMITCSAAAGISLAVGSPIGGVVFAIEVISTIYMISNIVKCILCAVLCTLFSNIIELGKYSDLFHYQEDFSLKENQTVPFSHLDIFLFMILAIVCGILGGILNSIISKIVYYKRKLNYSVISNRFIYVGICGFIIANTTFIFPPLREDDRNLLNIMFERNDFNITRFENKILEKNKNELLNISLTIPKIDEVKELFHLNPFTSSIKYINEKKLDENHSPKTLTVYNRNSIYLFILLMFKILITILSLTMPIPNGLFSPFFLIGALLGRLVGHIFYFNGNIINESYYSIVGAACVMSGATQTISSSIIIFEITGKTGFLPMLLCCTICSNLISKTFSLSFFDIFLYMRNVPHLPSLGNSQLYSKKAEDIMNEAFRIFYSKLTIINSLELLCVLPKNYNYEIPILNSKGGILFTLKPNQLLSIVRCQLKKVAELGGEENENNNEDSIEDDSLDTNKVSGEGIKYKKDNEYIKSKEFSQKINFVLDYLEIKFTKGLVFSIIQKFSNFNNINKEKEISSGNIQFIKDEEFDKEVSIEMNSLDNSKHLNILSSNKNSNLSQDKNNLVPSSMEVINEKSKSFTQEKSDYKKNICKILKKFWNRLKINAQNLALSPIEKEKLKQANLIIEHQILTIIEEIKDKNIFKSIIVDYSTVPNKYKSSYTVETKLSCIKLHFIFTFLNLNSVFIVNKAKLVGIITKEHFIQCLLEYH